MTAVTQGEYTKYEDIPVAVEGENPGWRRVPSTFMMGLDYSGMSDIVVANELIKIVKDGSFVERQ